MKTITKLATAALLAISTVAPALATEAESLTLQERNVYVNATQHRVATHRAMDAMAYAPAASVVAGRDQGIASQR